MCGIVGIFQSNQCVEGELLKKMTDVVQHRGPDDFGYYLNPEKNLGLGFRRLSIIDLQKGHQPLSNEEGTIWIIFNGEIYNFLELKCLLENKGHKFKTKTDTECIVHGYEEYGEEIFTLLNGMFSIAIWDGKNHKLILARDRAGEKPLYYFYKNNIFIFASELKSILLHPKVSKEINGFALDEYFSYGFISAPNSIFKNIYKLEAGHYLVFKNLKIKKSKYWEINLNKKYDGDYESSKTEVFKLLNDSVRQKMNSDVPLGAFLSGGIDSSIVVALMATNSTSKIKTFSIGFEESEYDERYYANLIAKKYDTEHTELVIKSDYSLEKIEKIINNFDEPFGDSSAIPTFSVSELTRKYVTVSLSGDGGDELFGGYNNYTEFFRRKKQFEKIPYLMKFVLSNIPDNFRLNKRLNRITELAGAKNDASVFINLLTLISEVEKKNLYCENIKKLVDHSDINTKDIKYQYFENSLDYINKMLYSDFMHYLPDDILVKVDRMSMLSSLESRAPFLDHNLIEFVFSLPGDWKIKNGNKKDLLKESLKDLLPNEILNRNKRGFNVPINHWFSSDLYEYASKKLLSKESKKFFNLNAVNKYLLEHKSNKKDNSTQIWLLLVFILWAEINQITL